MLFAHQQKIIFARLSSLEDTLYAAMKEQPCDKEVLHQVLQAITDGPLPAEWSRRHDEFYRGLCSAVGDLKPSDSAADSVRFLLAIFQANRFFSQLWLGRWDPGDD